LHPPTSVVGDRISAWQGQTHEGRTTVPVWVVMWSHGNAIGASYLFGNKASAARPTESPPPRTHVSPLPSQLGQVQGHFAGVLFHHPVMVVLVGDELDVRGKRDRS
jgi:hypothetical protein